ncbi:MFS transporter [Streptomyces sp. QH1-20]|uniref:MFS transporter n=1 Tax=Streptomyces sp. QH1-20 TaxID=3240934 RepID=UPI003516DD9F
MKGGPTTPDGSARRATVRLYLLLTGLDFFGDMCLTVTSVLLLGERGLSSGTIIWLIASVWLLEALLEVPTGVFADAIGRRASVVVGFAVRAVGYGMLFFSADPAVAVAGTLIAAVGTPFASGSLDAWAVDRLQREDPSASLDALFARGRMAENAGIVTGTVAGAAAGQFLGLAVPQLLAGSACLAGAVCTTVLLRGRAPVADGAGAGADRAGVRRELAAASLEALRGCRRALGTDRVLTGLLLCAAALCLFRGLPGVQWTVHFDVLTGGSLIALAAARCTGDLLQIPLLEVVARKVRQDPGARARIIVLAAVAAGLFLGGSALASSGWVGVPLYIGFVMAGGLCMPGLKAALNERVPARSRATMLSAGGLFNSLATGLGLYVMGGLGVGLADVTGVWTTAAAGTTLFGAAAAWFCVRSLRTPPASVAVDSPVVGGASEEAEEDGARVP